MLAITSESSIWQALISLKKIRYKNKLSSALELFLVLKGLMLREHMRFVQRRISVDAKSYASLMFTCMRTKFTETEHRKKHYLCRR